MPQIPLADFLLTHMGYVQNEQALLSAERVKTIGLLLADKLDGPFQLDVRAIRAINMRKEISNMDAAAPTPTLEEEAEQQARKGKDAGAA